MLILAIRTASTDLVQGATTVLATIVVLFALVVAIGVTLLVRRRRRSPTAMVVETAPPGQIHGETDPAELAKRANIALVRLDDAVAKNEDELGFAIAQFGDRRSQAYAEALAGARTNLTESFRLKQRLDDGTPDSATQQREWNARIVHLCETSQRSLAAESAAFDALRRRETDAPTELKAVRMLVVSVSMRVPAAESTLAALTARYSPAVTAPVSGNVAQARALTTTAGQVAEKANAMLADPSATDVAEQVQDARDAGHAAVRLLDAVDALSASLDEESLRLTELSTRSQADLAEARAARDAAADPDSGAAIGSAITALEGVLGSLDGTDPASSIDRLHSAIATLDAALANARNQAQRLTHASAALAGVLVSARSQIVATRDFIASRRRDVGTEARTRLAEAQRLLTVAEAQSDPVVALDTARSSANYSRDADALARFDAQG